MSWLNPAALAALALLLPYVAWKLFQLRPPTRRTAVFFLWDIAGPAESAHRLRCTPRSLASILFGAAGLAAVLLIFAGPVGGRPPAPVRCVAVVMDTSASMRAFRSDARTRWEHARSAVQRALGQMEAADRVAVVEAGAGVRGEGLPPVEAFDRIRPLSPQARALPDADLLAAVRTAGSAPGVQQVRVYTDHRPDAASGPPPEGPPVVWEVFADPPGNVALEAVEVETAGPRWRCFAVFRNFGAADRSVRVRVAASEHAEITSEPVDLPAGTRRRWTSPFLPDRGRVPVRVDLVFDGDEFPADDRAWLAPPLGEKIRIALVTPDNPHLARALASATPGADVIRVPDAGAAEDADLRVFDRTAVSKIARGFTVVVAPVEESDLFTVGADLRAGPGPHTLPLPEDPMVAGARLAAIPVGPARVVRPKAGTLEATRVLLSAGEHPLLWVYEKAGVHLAVLAWDVRPEGQGPAWATSPEYPSFPIFWTNVVRWAAGGLGRTTWSDVRPGAPVRIPSGWPDPVRWEGPDETTSGTVAADGADRFFTPPETGLYHLTAGAREAWVAANLLGTSESDTRGNLPFALPPALPEGRSAPVPAGPWTTALLACALAATACGWALERGR